MTAAKKRAKPKPRARAKKMPQSLAVRSDGTWVGAPVHRGRELPRAESVETIATRIRRKLDVRRGRAARTLGAELDKAHDDMRAQVVQALMVVDAWLGSEETPEGEEE